ncbi:MAG: ATP-binding protein [Clostridiales bacterium]|nr:ATP-binding protein [Clostridiales bacterium]
MLKLLIGVKGSGKTKTLISMVNEAVESSQGAVVCIEKGIKLRYDVNYRCRLINVDEYFVFDAEALYGFVAGILASNHDVTHVFVDSALRICNNDRDAFEKLLQSLDELSDSHKVDIVMTSSLPVEEADDTVKRYI